VSGEAHRVQVGAELRRVREQLGLSGMQVAAALGWSQSKVSRIEAGRLGTALNDLAALLNLYGLTEEVRAELLSVAVAGDGLPGAWIVRAGDATRRQGEVASIEARVRRIRQYGALTVPGLLQAEGYTRAVAAAGGFGQVEDIVQRRLARQKLLFSDHPPSYEVVLDERALMRWSGDPLVLDEQLDRLGVVGALPTVELRLLPTGGAARAIGFAQFLIYDFLDPAAPSVVMLESQTADTYLSAPEDVTAYSRLFDGLSLEALTPTDSGEWFRSMHQAATA
jgi:transcriptional regulator with XRE-family HTH domain